MPISPCGVCDACKHGNPQYCKKTWSHAVGLSLDYSGGYAEVSACHPNMVRKLPDIISNEEACMVEPSAVSLHAVNLANVKVGDKVCVTILPATDINGNKYDETGAGGTVLEIKQNSTIIQLFDGPTIEAEGRIFDKIN